MIGEAQKKVAWLAGDHLMITDYLPYQEWLKDPQRGIPFIVGRKWVIGIDDPKEHLHQAEVLCFAVRCIARHQNNELQGEGYTIQPIPDPLGVISASAFAYEFQENQYSIYYEQKENDPIELWVSAIITIN